MDDFKEVLVGFVTDPARAIPGAISIAIQLGATHKLKFFLNPDLPKFKKDRYIEAGSIVVGTLSYALMRLFGENISGNEYTAYHFGFDVFVGLALTFATPYLYKLLPEGTKKKLSVERKIVQLPDGTFEERDANVKSKKHEKTVVVKK